MTAAQLSAVVASVAFAGFAVLAAWLEVPWPIPAALLVLSAFGFLIILGMLAADARQDRTLPPPGLGRDV